MIAFVNGLPVTRAELHEFDRAGAQVRLQAISEEQAAIIRKFPHFRSATASSLDGAGPVAHRARKRRRMSAAQRKAVGRRMRAYWANRRAAKGNIAKKSVAKPNRKREMSAAAASARPSG
jgi:hypothetical protein